MSEEKANMTEELTAVLEEIVEGNDTPNPVKGEATTQLNETDFLIGARQYQLVANHREAFQLDKLGERYSEVLARYDYIVGDWGYDQLRLKGFFEASNKKALPEQKIDTLEDYLYEYCNFGCAYFVIKRVGGKREKTVHRKRKPKAEEQQAHISEQKQPIKNQKPRPKPKDKVSAKERTAKEKNQKEKNNTNKNEKNKGFTIRKRENK
ncbi:MAG: YutD family protein [Enterococcus lemanii]|jgi:uncharacterized protein YutD